MKNKFIIPIIVLSIALVVTGYMFNKSITNKNIEIENLKEQLKNELEDKNAKIKRNDTILEEYKQSCDDYIITSSKTYEILRTLYENDFTYLIENSVSDTKVENNTIYFPKDNITFNIPKEKLELWNRGHGKGSNDEYFLFYNITNKTEETPLKSLYVTYKKVDGKWLLLNMYIDIL